MPNLPSPAEPGNAASSPAPDAPAPRSRRRIKPYSRICPNCAGEFEVPAKGPGGHKRYCAEKCRMEWGAREKLHGAAIITQAKIWRKNRGSGEIGKSAFQRFVEALDILIAEDEEAGRPKLTANGPVQPFLRAAVEDRYLDRKRR